MFPLCSLAWGRTMVGVMVTSSKRTYVSLPCLPELLQSVPVTLQQATHTSAGDSWTGEASLAQSLVGPRLLSLGSWCTRFSLCPPRVSVSPVLWKFCKQIPLAFKVKFPVGLSPSALYLKKKSDLLFIFLGSKITIDGDCSMTLKGTCSLEEKLWPTQTAY